MNADQLKDIIRKIVNEEIQKSLPLLVPKIIAEAFSGKSNLQEKVTDDFFEELSSHVSPRQAVPQTPRRLAKDPVLNAILNETQGGVPQEMSYGAPIPNSFRQPPQKLNVQQAPTAPMVNETTKAQAELGVFKDYRKLMKAVDTKKKSGGFNGGAMGGFSIDGGVPTDFSTID
jgi:hypothetical protein